MANLSNINNKFLVTTGGKVGIGITAPTGILHTDQTFSGYAPVTFKTSVTNQGQFVELITSTDEGSKYTGIESISLQTGNGWKVWGGGNNFGEMYLSVSGSHAIVIKNDLKVGIGTNSPATFLQVSGAGNRAGGNIQMGLSSQGANKWSYLTGTHYNSTTEPEGFALIGGYSDIDENRVVIGGDIWETNPATSIHFWTHNSSTHAQGGSQKMVIDSSGNVGIGTTLPSSLYADQLVVKCSSSENGITILSNSTTDANYIMFADGTTGSDRFRGQIKYNHQNNYMEFATNASNAMIINSSGNVGIGTGNTAPNKKLTVYGGNDNGIWVDSQGGQYTSIAWGHNGTEKTNIAWDNTNGYTNITTYGGGHLALSTGGGIKAFLNSSGNFGVGDTAPTSISINTSSLSVNSSRTDLSGGLISKSNGTVKHQQYWDSSGYGFNITANSGVFKFNGADVQVNANIKANDVNGKIFSNVASWAYVTFKNDLFSFGGTEGALWEYTIKMNPNSGGSGAYRDFYYGKLGIGIGWNGSALTQFLWQQQDQTLPRSLYGSGGGNFSILFRMYYSGGVYTELAYGTAWTLRIQGLSTSTYGDIFFRRLA